MLSHPSKWKSPQRLPCDPCVFCSAQKQSLEPKRSGAPSLVSGTVRELGFVGLQRGVPEYFIDYHPVSKVGFVSVTSPFPDWVSGGDAWNLEALCRTGRILQWEAHLGGISLMLRTSGSRGTPIYENSLIFASTSRATYGWETEQPAPFQTCVLATAAGS